MPNSVFRLLFFMSALALVSFPGCQRVEQSTDNPHMEGFNLKDSDARAIEIADQVMAALGGRKNWDDTRYITWNFFGRRRHVWDKWSGNLRMESKDGVVLMNLNTGRGRAWEDGQEIAHPDSLAERLKFAKSAWINDGYWLLMPYKLKDTGVTLKYMGETTLENYGPSDILQLTFTEVGDTPQNKYWVYVNRESKLVVYWSYFSDAGDSEPRISTPWGGWRRHGNIMLSGDRGPNRQLSEIGVFSELAGSVFTSPAPVALGGE